MWAGVAGAKFTSAETSFIDDIETSFIDDIETSFNQIFLFIPLCNKFSV